jgi:hypothetical protein
VVAGWILAIGGALLVFSGVSLFAAVRYARWGDVRRFWKQLGVTVPIAVGAFVALWWGIQHPGIKDPRGQALGPDWTCDHSLGGAAVYCSRDR